MSATAAPRQARRFVILSGCSGGGKSTLLAELARRGFATVAEPGRRVVARELAAGGTALPWADGDAFARRLVALARRDLEEARSAEGTVFFDRGLVDAALALEHVAGVPADETLAEAPRFDPLVFMAPPWPEIYVRDDERRHSLAEAEEEHRRLLAAYPRLGYEPVLLPRTGVAARADHVLAWLNGGAGGRCGPEPGLGGPAAGET